MSGDGLEGESAEEVPKYRLVEGKSQFWASVDLKKKKKKKKKSDMEECRA